MDPSLGARLRAHREEHHISLTAVSASTKIKLFMLEALEQDDVSQWPVGIYRRAYVRAYARAVGLDPETLVREFLEAHPDPVCTPPAEETELETPPWPAEIRRLVTSALAAVPLRRPRLEPAPAVAVEPAESAEHPIAPLPLPVEPTSAEPMPISEAHDAPFGRPDSDVSLIDAAEICARVGRARNRREVIAALADGAEKLDALGMVVWSWDSQAAALRPAFVHGYSEAAIARMPRVRSDADNAIAEAFRCAETRVVAGEAGMTGAIVAPLLAHGECVGVLALELRPGDEDRVAVRAFATLMAAACVALAGSAALAEAVNA